MLSNFLMHKRNNINNNRIFSQICSSIKRISRCLHGLIERRIHITRRLQCLHKSAWPSVFAGRGYLTARLDFIYRRRATRHARICDNDANDIDWYCRCEKTWSERETNQRVL